MAPTTYKIKKKMLEKGDTFEGLAGRWHFTRDLLTKVAHLQRGNGKKTTKAQKRFARYVGEPVDVLFPNVNGQQARAA